MSNKIHPFTKNLFENRRNILPLALIICFSVAGVFASHAVYSYFLAASISINTPSVTEGEGTSGTVLLNFTVSISGTRTDPTQPVTVDFATGNTTVGGNPATAGVDYVAQNGTLSFAVGETSRTIAVVVNKDCTAEATEYLGIVLSNPTNAAVSGSNFYGVISTDDSRQFFFTGNGNGVTEGEGTSGTTLLNMPVTLSGSPVTADTISQCGGVAVNFATGNTTVGGSPATAGVDYVAQNGTLSFGVGETSKTITVVVNKDCTAEATEYFGVVFSNPTNATVSAGNFYGGINTDDSRQFLFSGNGNGVTEGEGTSGTTLLNMPVTLSGSPVTADTISQCGGVAVNFATGNTTVGGSPATAGVDYVAQSGSFSFGVGETSKTITVVVNKDCTAEATEYFGVVFSNPTNATVSAGNFYGGINTDDSRQFLFSGNGNGVTEGEGTSGTTLLNMPVTLSGSPVTADTISQCGGVAVNFATGNTTVGGSPATAGVDYVAQNGTLSFGVGETSKTITVVVNKDCTAEATEYFGVVFSNPTNATVSAGNFYGGINTDDSRQFLFSGNGNTVAEGNAVTVNLNMPVTLSGSPVIADTISQCGGVAVNFATGNTTVGGNPATVGVDYVAQNGTLSFGVGETSKTIAVVVNPDCIPEATEYLGIVLSNPTNAAINGSNFYGGITNSASGCLEVTNGANSGTGSLRQALEQANSNADSNIITFNFAGNGPFVIAPTTPLPAFNNPVVIDGFSQPGSSVNTDPQGNNAVLLIEIDGTNAGANVNGFSLNNGSTIRGLIINHFGGNGIVLSGNNNLVEGNIIGTDATGTLNRGNGQNGILINSGSNNIIGGTGVSARNTIAFNGEDGIKLATSGNGHRISSNSIHSNGTTNLHLGIDLQGTDGITENDQNDPDITTNNLQNYPVIISATQNSSRVIGILNSTPSTAFRLEFFNSPTAISSGKTFVGAFDVTTDASGYANFDQTFTGVNSPFGSWMTATATRSAAPFDTSEFSYPKQVAFIPTAASVTVGGRVVTANGRGIGGARITMTEADGMVRYAMTNPFGYYRFDEVAIGNMYIFEIESKNHKFAAPQRIVTINEEIDQIDFIALE